MNRVHYVFLPLSKVEVFSSKSFLKQSSLIATYFQFLTCRHLLETTVSMLLHICEVQNHCLLKIPIL